ncbi:hypothetical protein OG874_25455 [Nocardia sp. NBC_00565]|uniref:hypothetical protein n=1 Tax=Nocardia sp. NBC_00565 TaxID=2975993 RepID=UPI002E811201|nr:hypothetical protein [Nocardia sp. NBC_00565]WUC00244.1 hypothetical protein OG874_25455 [Nocardia sp. NBC_00565]
MDIHAYPTEATIPVNLTEAQRIADHYLSTDGDTIINLLTEFDAGFTVVAIFPPPPGVDPHVRPLPPPIGGSVCVIDKPTGAISYWPTYPTDMVAAQYTQILQSGRLIIEDSWPEDEDSTEGE